MKLKLFATLAVCGTMLISCNEGKFKENSLNGVGTEVSKTQNGTIEFKDGTFHFSTLAAFEEFSAKLLKEESFRALVSEKYGRNLLVNKIDDPSISEKDRHILDNTPSQYPYILNKEGGYVLGDKYFAFGMEAQYVVDINKKNQIDWTNEKSIDRTQLRAFSYGRTSNIVKTSDSNARLDVGRNQKSFGGAQHEFVQQSPVSGDRKWVDEVDALDIYLGTAQDPNQPWNQTWYDKFEIVLVFKAKLEYKSNGSWKPAGNNRTITPYIDHSLSIGPSPANATVLYTNYKIGTSCCVSNQPVPVTGTTDWQAETHSSYLDKTGQHFNSLLYITGSGSFKHEIVGDSPSNVWFRTFTW